MKRKGLKWELAQTKKAFVVYGQGWRYIFNKFFLAKKILTVKKTWPSQINAELSIHVLACNRDFIMLLWALQSFFNFFNHSFQLFVHSDGTLTVKQINILKKFFPNFVLIASDELLNNYQQVLNSQPIIKNFLIEHPEYYLMKKIVDPYFVSDKKNILVIDSDILWFQTPSELLTALNDGLPSSLMMWSLLPGPVYFKDNTSLSEELSHHNSGVVLYRRDNFDLTALADYLTKVDVEHPNNFQFIEEGGFATCLKKIIPLPKEKYIIKGAVNEQTVARHYTSPRRPGFYLEGLPRLRKIFNL
ncbi:MAG TPA: hypothetical protein PLH37_00475 [bacterium]|nr:hypothetical protein [bacterium]